MLKTIIKTSAITLLLSANLSQAAPSHEDQCAIWLCLPGGFPNGCGAAKSAMKWRIKHHQSPLPSFSSCAIDFDSNGDGKEDFIVRERRVILINKQQECLQTRSSSLTKSRRQQQKQYCQSLEGQYEARSGNTCWKVRPGKDRDGVLIPGCVGVFREFKTMDTINNTQIGKTIYWNNNRIISL